MVENKIKSKIWWIYKSLNNFKESLLFLIQIINLYKGLTFNGN